MINVVMAMRVRFQHCLLLIIFLIPGSAIEVRGEEFESWYLSRINIPLTEPIPTGKPIIIAVVDDGIRLTHEDIVDFIWMNSNEVAGNGIDDDGNGYVDDVSGWDVSDGDTDVSPPPDRLDEFNHGTFLAGVITDVAKNAFGSAAPEMIKIMPVKAISDDADRLYVMDGYKGIEYAVNSGADIILAAWGAVVFSDDDRRVLSRAVAKDILIVASVGNFPDEQDQYPAAYGPVLAVAAIGKDNRKIEGSNYGLFIDISAPGQDIQGSSSINDTAHMIQDGSSPAAAITAIGAGIVMQHHPELTASNVAALLIDSAVPPVQENLLLFTRMGAGRIDITSAVEGRLLKRDGKLEYRSSKTLGFIHIGPLSEDLRKWTLQPMGDVQGIRINQYSSIGTIGKGEISIYAGDSPESRLVGRYAIEDFPESVYIAGNVAHVVVKYDNEGNKGGWMAEYRGIPIDRSTLYCSGLTKVNQEGWIEDGSGLEPYSPNSGCKWLITAPPGKVIRFRFAEFATEPIADKIYFFNGTGTHERIMAVFSGPNIPPELISWDSKVLLWFVTDQANQGEGWKVEIKFIDP